MNLDERKSSIHIDFFFDLQTKIIFFWLIRGFLLTPGPESCTCVGSMLFPDLPVQALTPDQAREKTKNELQAAAYDAALTLRAGCAGNADSDQIKAATAILDRAGFPPRTSLTIDDHRMAEFEQMSEAEIIAFILAQRGEKPEALTKDVVH